MYDIHIIYIMFIWKNDTTVILFIIIYLLFIIIHIIILFAKIILSCYLGGGGANAPKGPTHIKNPKRALENGAFWGLLGPFDPVFLA